MDSQTPAPISHEPLDVEAAPPEAPLVEEASAEYLGRWNRLISTTNWEKGCIISAWREALREAEASPASYSDEAWSRRVGNVTPQHVGRLRRVFGQFGSDHERYPGLYWSHFQAALDWGDAEMWLQGAVESGWSVAQMRNQRWEALGAPPEKRPREEDIIVVEPNEDVDPALEQALPQSISDSPATVRNAEADDELRGSTDRADEAAAAAFQRLRRRHRRIGTMDLKIAAIVLSRNATLLSRNLRDFGHIPDLHVEDWTTPS